MKVVTKDEMELIDDVTSDEYKIPSTLLMENAGIEIALKIIKIYTHIPINQSISILVGPGNNGGDGLVIARYFFTNKIPVKVFIIGKREKFKGNPLLNITIAEKLGISITYVSTIDTWNNVKKRLFSCSILVDAIFGTGLRGEVREFYRQIIDSINENVSQLNKREDFLSDKEFWDKSPIKIISVDVPSGLLNIDDKQNKCIIKADITVTVGLPKIGMVDYPGKDFVGRVHIVNIGFPEVLLTDSGIKKNIITSEMVKQLLPKRKPNTHKGNYGHLLVISGSKQYTGAAILACQSALKMGCGLVTLASVPSVCQTLRNYFPEVICWELPETDDETISNKAFPIIEEKLSLYQAIVFGSGVGQSLSTGELLISLISNYDGKLLIDADGLNLLSKQVDSLNSKKCNVILTPHIKEMSRLIQKSSHEVIDNKITLTKDFAKKYKVVTVLKSAVTLISDSDEELYFNTTGNEGMATGGTGDVLSGMIGSLLVQGLGVLEASVAGVYIHGLSGDIAKKRLSSASLIASDLISNFHLAFNQLIPKVF